MNDELIQGRNLITHGRFSPGWQTVWKHDGTGAIAPSNDVVYGSYLTMNRLAKVTQIADLPVFTEEQIENVTYRTRFVFENYNEGNKAGVLLRTSGGTEYSIDLSGKHPQPSADWNEYSWDVVKGVTAADITLEMELQGSDATGSGGLRMTDIEVDALLGPLQLRFIKLDEKVYEP